MFLFFLESTNCPLRISSHSSFNVRSAFLLQLLHKMMARLCASNDNDGKHCVCGFCMVNTEAICGAISVCPLKIQRGIKSTVLYD